MIVYVVNKVSYLCGEAHGVCYGVFATEQEAKEKMHRAIAETEEVWFEDMKPTDEDKISITKLGETLRLENPTTGANESFSIQAVEFVGKLE